MSPRPGGDGPPLDFGAELASLQQAVTQLQAAFPDRSEGWDEARAVHVAWSAAEGVEIVTVARDWEQRVTADRLGATVVEAYTAAMVARAEDADRTLQQDEVWNDIQAGRPTRSAPPAVELPPDVTPSADAVTLAEQVLATTARVEAEPETGPPLGRGSSGGVEVVLDGSGLRSCEVDPRWAAGRSGLVVVQALQQAVAAARAATPPADLAADSPLGELDGLIGQLLSTLKSATDTPRGGDA